MRPMTEKQREFAEEARNIVYSYLKARKLDREDFYDIVVFGFLEAVQRYVEDAALAEQYRFSTIAFRKMDDALAAHRIKENRIKRKAEVWSLDAPVGGTEDLFFINTIPSPEAGADEQAETRILTEQIMATATDRQRKALVATANGYTGPEAAELLGTTASAIYCRMHALRRMAREAIAV